jgi:hypothetical protein
MRDALILAALADSVDAAHALRADRVPPWGALHSALFRHALAVGAAARSRFNVGPFERAGYAETVMATGGADFEQRTGASLRVIVDVGDWDRSAATNAPGQSGAPASPHFADLARLWAAGEYVPLSFSERAVQEHAEATLTPPAACDPVTVMRHADPPRRENAIATRPNALRACGRISVVVSGFSRIRGGDDESSHEHDRPRRTDGAEIADAQPSRSNRTVALTDARNACFTAPCSKATVFRRQKN